MKPFLSQYIFQIFETYPFLAMFVSFFIGYCCMPLILKIAVRKQLVVKPNKRSSHIGKIPNVGGLNIFTAFFISSLLCISPITEKDFNLFLVGLYIIFFVGFIDDLLAISPTKKFFGEILSAFFLVVIANRRLTNLHGLFYISEMNTMGLIILSYIISILLCVFIINAINLIDGVDGLATGIGALICGFFGIYFQLCGNTDYSIMAYCMIGALAIFFIFNVFGNRSKIFMGDSGSLVLGYVVYFFVVTFCQQNIPTSESVKLPYYIYAAPAVAMCVLAIPVFDTFRVMITRIKHGQSPFYADKNHIHHLLLSLGLKHRQVTFVLMLATLSFFGLALIGKDWHNWLLGGVALFLFAIYIVIIWRLLARKHRLENK